MEASMVNQVHPDAPPEDDFFGVGAATPAADPVPAAPAPATAAEPTPVAETPAPAPAAAQEAAPETTTAAVDAAVKKKPVLDREYIIYQPVALTEATLTHLLAEAQSGNGGSVREAMFELDRIVTRNTKEAAGQAYNKHKATLPEKVKLNVVSANSMQTKTITPKERPVEMTLDIS